MLKILTFALSLTAFSCHVFANNAVINKNVQPQKPAPNKALIKTDDPNKSSFSQTPSEPEAIDVLIDKLNAIKTLSANFTLKITSSKINNVISGEVYIKRPDMIAWITRHPHKSDSIIFEGKVWNIDHDLSQVNIQKQDSKKQGITAKLLSGNSREALVGYYVVENSHGDNIRYQIRPNGNDGLFILLEIYFTKDILTGFLIADSFGSKRNIDLENVKFNDFISNDFFKPNYPKNYHVFDETIEYVEVKGSKLINK